MVVVSKRPLDFIDSARRPSYPSHDRKPSQSSITRPRTTKADVEVPPSSARIPATRASQRISEGQHFRVGNIGQGGALYLRPVNGKPPQQYSNSSWVLPSDLDIPSEDVSGEESHWDIGSTFSSPERIWTPQKARLRQSTMGSTTSHLPAQLSPSRLGTRSKTPSRMEQRPATQQPDNVTVVVGQASAAASRPGAFQLLEVPIPHYRLGAPQFTDKGSAIFRNSIASSVSGYSRSSVISSRQDYDTMFPEPPQFRLETPTPTPTKPQLKQPEMEEQADGLRRSSSARTITQDTHTQAGASLQKELYFTPQSPPQHEPRQDLRLSAQRDVHPAHRTVEITGATPTGLMAQITSPSDYIGHFELLHDFFLTFRAYISQSDLLQYLFHRLDWSIRIDTDFARIVKVRVFVALRHWLLNYFLEDFVLDRSLRSQFCELANGLATKLKTLSVKDGDRNICREIKKCYRDQLRLYWDLPRTLDPDVAVYPGGDLGSRDAMIGHGLTFDVEDVDARKRSNSSALARSQFTALPEHEALTNTATNIDPLATTGPEQKVVLRPRHQYRNSDQSVDVAWCAMPRKALRKLSHTSHSKSSPEEPQPLGPRPITPDILAQYPLSRPHPPFHPQTPRRPFQSDAGTSSIAGHYGSPSFVNGVSPAPTGVSFTGSLVRGMGVQPMSPKIVFQSEAHLARSISPSFVDPFTPTKHVSRKTSASPTPSLLGSVRRAFSTRKHSNASSLRSLNISRASGRRSATPTPNRMRSVTPGEMMRPSEDMPRIDVLAAQLLESFERAIQGQPPRTASDPRTIGENALIEQNSGITAVPAAIPEVDDTRQSLVAPVQPSSTVHDFAAIDDVLQHRPEMSSDETGVRLRGKHQYSTSAESAITDWSAGIRASHHLPREEVITEDVSPEEEHTDALLRDATARFNDAPVLEISEDEDAAQKAVDSDQPQPLYLRNYRGFPNGMSAKSIESTQKSLDVETLVTEATDTSTDDPFSLERITNRQLKRQPGGDLRAHDHVRSLMIPGQTQSLYSIDDAGSHVPSMTLDTTTSNGGRASTFNMLTTHSSQQLASMDPAFVAAAADLAALPDVGDDGGIEATLRKLEGRFDEPQEFTDAQRAEALSLLRRSEDIDRPDSAHAQREDLRRHREEEVDGNMITEPPTDQLVDAQNSFTTGTTQLQQHNGSSTRAGSVSESMTSCSSLPLIERGASLMAPRRKHSRQKLEDMLAPQSDPTTAADQSYVTAMESEYVSGSDAVEQYESSVAGSVIAHSPAPQQYNRNIPSRSTQRSFLLDPEDDTPSILSMVADEDEDFDVAAADDMRSFYDDDADSVHEGDIMPHPFAHPKTPPRLSASSTQMLNRAPAATATDQEVEAERKTTAHRHIPLQERVDYHARASANELRPESRETIRASNAIHAPPPRPLFSSTSNHYPFVLAYDSTVLAHQFTLIEKDALSDITWRELVDHHWSQTEDPHRNWADYLASFSSSPEELYLRGGIDICTTRFNLMVQWVISEILLTQDLHERAAAISKFIQIAAECRKIRNWATAIQLTMALTNSRVQRLTRTWSMVLDHDRQELQALDILILPARNFSNIRSEQDRFRTNSDRANEDARLGRTSPSGIGCIPWMALYTRDLVANAQKPEYLTGAVAVTADGVVLNVPEDVSNVGGWRGMGREEERVINVERMRTQASIVRHFVDMKRASEEYVLREVPELLSRCLWIARLGEEECEARSRMLE